MDQKKARENAAQFYVAKNLERNPSKTVNFIINNRSYFPSISDDWLKQVKTDYNLTRADIEKEKNVVFTEDLEEEADKNEKVEMKVEMKVSHNLADRIKNQDKDPSLYSKISNMVSRDFSKKEKIFFCLTLGLGSAMVLKMFLKDKRNE